MNKKEKEYCGIDTIETIGKVKSIENRNGKLFGRIIFKDKFKKEFNERLNNGEVTFEVGYTINQKKGEVELKEISLVNNK